MFVKYVHLERFGSEEVLEIDNNDGPIYVFPKLDGANGSLWFNKETGQIECASRNRVLSLDSDNRNFMATIVSEANGANALKERLEQFPNYIFYGEWLVPHTIKNYEKTAWNKFYIFDVFDLTTQKFLPFNDYSPLVEEFEKIHSGIQLLSPVAVGKRINLEILRKLADANEYLMETGFIGEGLVVKRYNFVNKYGRTVWAKFVRSEFKTAHIREMGPQTLTLTELVEEKIVAKYINEYLVSKTVEKLRDKYEFEGVLPNKYISELLNTVFYDLITEEMWQIIKEFKRPKIDFKLLMQLSFSKTKKLQGIS